MDSEILRGLSLSPRVVKVKQRSEISRKIAKSDVPRERDED